ncbi:HNH endonuclease [Agrobacterium fabacearum CFBP 5771]|uniref:HNH endonuclease n=1 Tax=Agrobacterium tumefaciens TaxID=358 RepID=UPI0009BA1E84|nr:HNH endonuclease signature motif containing protein [Agrobacterium tumefaciens]CVI22707.1 HNH endonuclease [Agrobacterium fabacearum CFBP 5771]
MARLTTLKPPLGTLPPRLGPAPGDERDRNKHRQTAEPWRKWYQLVRWKRLRIETFKRDLFTCQMAGCGKIEGNTSKLICDHVTPHKGDEALFFDEKNLQTLCKPCHDTLKQREERSRGRW